MAKPVGDLLDDLLETFAQHCVMTMRAAEACRKEGMDVVGTYSDVNEVWLARECGFTLAFIRLLDLDPRVMLDAELGLVRDILADCERVEAERDDK